MKVQFASLSMVLAFFSCLAPGVSRAQEDTSLSIRECIEYATQNNSTIRVARLNEEVGLQQVREVRGGALPQINVNGSFEDRLKLPLLVLPPEATAAFPGGGSGSGDNEAGIPLGYQYTSSLTAEVSQAIINPSLWIGLKAAKSSNDLYRQQTQQAQEQVAYNIASAYYQAVVAQKQLDLLSSNLESTNRTLANTKLQFDNGVAKQVDVKRLQVNASNLQSQIQQSKVNLQQVTNQLKYLMGMPLDQPITLSDNTFTFEQPEEVLTELPEDFYTRRLDYNILQTNLDLQELDRKNNAAGYYPTLNAFANYGYQAQGADFGLFPINDNGWVDYTTASIGLRLNIPVFDGLQRDARIQQSKIKASQLQENIQDTKRSINLETSNALSQYESTLQRINAEQQNVALAQDVYQITELEFKEGVGTSTDVVEAETALREAQTTYITTLLDLYVARLDLENAQGNILPYINSL